MSDISDWALEDEDDDAIEAAALRIQDGDYSDEDDGSTGVIEAPPDPFESVYSPTFSPSSPSDRAAGGSDESLVLRDSIFGGRVDSHGDSWRSGTMIGGDTSIRSSGGADLWKREDGSIRDQRTGVVYREEAPSIFTDLRADKVYRGSDGSRYIHRTDSWGNDIYEKQ